MKPGAATVLPRTIRRARAIWRRIRAWRRIQFTRGGLIFTAGTFVIGFAALNTGNNLLYLLLGAMLGVIAVSGWLSEQTIRGLLIDREVPHAVTVGQVLRITYTVTNTKRHLPTLALEIAEEGLAGRAFIAEAPPDDSVRTRSSNRFSRRGVFRLRTITLSTSFPFGLFRKERDLERPGAVLVWPRTDRVVDDVAWLGGRRQGARVGVRTGAGQRGEYRDLRSYRVGDDPRDIHWRSTARLGEPILRQYEEDVGVALWICLDLRREPSEQAEVDVEIAASLAARCAAEGRPFGFVAGEALVPPGEGAGQLERILDLLAAVDFRPSAPPSSAPATPDAVILIGDRP